MTETQPELVIIDPLVTVEPGQVATTTARIRNVGNRVALYSFSPVPGSQAAAWTTIAPPTVNLLEGEDGEIQIILSPPLDAATVSGRVPYGLVADPGPDAGILPAVAEADVAVGAVHALDAAIRPARGKGRLRGKLRVEFANRGNDEVRVAVTAHDDADNEGLHFASADGRVTVPPGATADALLRVRPDKPKLLGKPVEHPFTVDYSRRADRRARLAAPTQDGEVSASLAGTWTQKPVVAKWMIVVAVLAVAAFVAFQIWRNVTEPDPPVRAPDPPQLAADPVSAPGTVEVRFDYDELPARVVVEAVDNDSADGADWDLYVPLPDVAAAILEGEAISSRAAAVLTLPEGLGAVTVRFRAEDADGRSSVWDGSAGLQVPGVDQMTAPRNVGHEWQSFTDIRLTWEPPADAAGRTLTYEVFRSDDGATSALSAVVDGTSATFEMTELFAVVVRARDGDDVSVFSEPFTPTPTEFDPPCEPPACQPATTTTTLPTPEDYFVVPQAAVAPTGTQQIEWTREWNAIANRILDLLEVGGDIANPLRETPAGGQVALNDGGRYLIADGFSDAASAIAVCDGFLTRMRALLDSGVSRDLSPCWVFGPDGFFEQREAP